MGRTISAKRWLKWLPADRRWLQGAAKEPQTPPPINNDQRAHLLIAAIVCAPLKCSPGLMAALWRANLPATPAAFLNSPKWREQARRLFDRWCCDTQMCEMVMLALPDPAGATGKYTLSAAFSTISQESST